MSTAAKRRLVIAALVAHVLDDLVYLGLGCLAAWGAL